MTQAFNCPSCKQRITIDDSPQQNELNQLKSQFEQLKKETKMPSYIPAYRCPDGDCGQIHKNTRYTYRPKGKCRNCDQYSNKKEGKCAWCKQDELEEIDQDELTDRGIDLPGYDDI